jgi:hypothetical protein
MPICMKLTQTMPMHSGPIVIRQVVVDSDSCFNQQAISVVGKALQLCTYRVSPIGFYGRRRVAS